MGSPMLRAPSTRPPSSSESSSQGPRSSAQVARAAQAPEGQRLSERPPAPRRRIPRAWLLGGLGGALLLLVIGLLAFGPIVRSRIAKEGERRRLDVTVGSVRPGFFAVKLGDVHVKLQGVSGIDVRIDEVHVDLSAGFSVRDVAAHGGEIHIEGEPEDVIERLRAFQKGGGAPASTEKGHRMPVSVDGLALAWKLPDGEIGGSGIKLSRGDDAIRMACGRLAATYKRASLEIVAGDVELGPDGVARRVSA